MEYILVADRVTKSFGDNLALKEVSLQIPKGSIYGLLGPNGAGKTTLLRIINQITYPDSGSVFFDGMPLHPDHVAQIGYLPEERGLYKSMKVGEQAMYLAQLKGLNRVEARKRLLHWFERLEIGNWWGRKVQELSKGMAQKIQFIVTVLHTPRLLIFDEPFSGFDPINANLIKEEILSLREQGTSIIFSTHRMESVEEICDYIALLNKAEKILDGKLYEIKKAYKNNVFEVGLATSSGHIAVKDIQDKFTVRNLRFESEQDQLFFSVQLPNGDTGQFLQLMSEYGTVNSFVETIPTANDIFIRAVQNKITHG